MVNPARILAAVGGGLEKRDTSGWSSVLSTSFWYASQPTSVTVVGYYSTTQAVSGGIAVPSTVYRTTAMTYSSATSPLISPTSPDAYCSTDISASFNSLLYIQGSSPSFQVGYTTPCVPTGFYTVDYYSPGICPSGYYLPLVRSFATTVSNAKVSETEGICCFSSFELVTTGTDGWYCATFFNPLPTTTGSLSATSTAAITQWTVTAQYASVTTSTLVYSTPVVSSGSIVTAATTSYSRVGTTSHLFTVVSGGYGAPIAAPFIPIRWQTTDKFVLDWLKTQSVNGKDNTPVPPPPPPPPPKSGISGGAIAGIVIGAIAILALFIGGLFFCLRRRKRRAQNASSPNELMAEHHYVQPKAYLTGNHGAPPMSPETGKSELDSRSLSPTKYSALSSTSPVQGVQSKPFLSPTITELQSTSPTESIAGNTLNERSFSPTHDANDQITSYHNPPNGPETDMHGFLISAPGLGPTTPPSQPQPQPQPQQARSSWLEKQHKQVKEEKARLMRLQELSEMEARLEEQLQRELADERPSELSS